MLNFVLKYLKHIFLSKRKETGLKDLISSLPYHLCQGVPPEQRRTCLPSAEELAEELELKKEAPRLPPAIQLGQFHIETWYSSPYPQEYARFGTQK